MGQSMPGLLVHHQLPEFTQTHVHWVGGAVQPSHPLSSPSPPSFNLSEHQDHNHPFPLVKGNPTLCLFLGHFLGWIPNCGCFLYSLRLLCFFFFSQSSPRCEGILTALSLTLTSDLHMSFAPLIWNSFQNSNIFKSFCLNHLHWFLFPMWNNAHNLFSHLNCPLQCGSFQIFQAHIILQFNG